jgi:hypothetical protein
MLTHWHISKIKNKCLINFNFSHLSSRKEIMIMMNPVMNEKVLKRRDICKWKIQGEETGECCDGGYDYSKE